MSNYENPYTIESKPFWYNGVRHRSQLEALWHIYFDKAFNDANIVYEAQAGRKLADFKLTYGKKVDYIEIKPAKCITKDDMSLFSKEENFISLGGKCRNMYRLYVLGEFPTTAKNYDDIVNHVQALNSAAEYKAFRQIVANKALESDIFPYVHDDDANKTKTIKAIQETFHDFMQLKKKQPEAEKEIQPEPLPCPDIIYSAEKAGKPEKIKPKFESSETTAIGRINKRKNQSGYTYQCVMKCAKAERGKGKEYLATFGNVRAAHNFMNAVEKCSKIGITANSLLKDAFVAGYTPSTVTVYVPMISRYLGDADKLKISDISIEGVKSMKNDGAYAQSRASFMAIVCGFIRAFNPNVWETDAQITFDDKPEPMPIKPTVTNRNQSQPTETEQLISDFETKLKAAEDKRRMYDDMCKEYKTILDALNNLNKRNRSDAE